MMMLLEIQHQRQHSMLPCLHQAPGRRFALTFFLTSDLSHFLCYSFVQLLLGYVMQMTGSKNTESKKASKKTRAPIPQAQDKKVFLSASLS